MQRAITIGEYLLAHALAALGEMRLDPVVADARHVLRWIRTKNKTAFSKRDAHQDLRGRFRRAKDIDPALELLEERDWIRHPPVTSRHGPGRKSSPEYQTHPSILNADTAGDQTRRLPSKVDSEDCEYSEGAPAPSAEIAL
jgi:hypothetical protein